MKRWKDCPFEIWLSIDRKIDTDFPYDNIVISSSPKNLVRMRDVDFITPYVIMMQDDHWLIDDVNTDKILECIEIAKKYNTGNLRLLQDPIAYDVFDTKLNLMEYKKGKAYRISARGGLWETEYLKNYIAKFEDFWEMERLGQKYSCENDKLILCTKHRTLPIIDAVHKRKYTEFAYAMLDAAGLDYEREIMRCKDSLISDIKGTIIEINPELITGIQSILNIGHKQKY
ncbi:hypothetical protein [Butyrivibrio fibrisolvens]|uniref:hypothetical protein n=1 Tax=Butyrivibrio fibrisolvens TaxID=831 RepID=UPI0003B43FC8|nr:hypothetical protein [Butyrivibrio fibrisolvens]